MAVVGYDKLWTRIIDCRMLISTKNIVDYYRLQTTTNEFARDGQGKVFIYLSVSTGKEWAGKGRDGKRIYPKSMNNGLLIGSQAVLNLQCFFFFLMCVFRV